MSTVTRLQITDPNGRLGRLIATLAVLSNVPIPNLARALRTHCRIESVEGRPFRTRHSYDGTIFDVWTAGDCSRTTIHLATEEIR